MTKEEQLIQINQRSENTLMQTLGIVFTDFGDDFLVAEMPIEPAVHQPLGMLHGGASVALAETVGSYLSNMKLEHQYAVGSQITANHLKSKRSGKVIATAKLLKKGNNIHYSEIAIRDEEGHLICHCTMNNVILNR